MKYLILFIIGLCCSCTNNHQNNSVKVVVLEKKVQHPTFTQRGDVYLLVKDVTGTKYLIYDLDYIRKYDKGEFITVPKYKLN